MNEMFSRFGAHEELHSDQGRNFEAEVFQEVCRLLGVKKTQTTPLYPQSDGLVERFNKTLAEQLTITGNRQADWDLHIPMVLWAYKSAVQESNGCTPAALMPYVVLAKLSDVVYRVQLTGRRRTVVLHRDRLAPYRPLARPQWGNRYCGGIVHWDCNISACNEDAIEPLRAYSQASCSSLGLCNAGWGL